MTRSRWFVLPSKFFLPKLIGSLSGLLLSVGLAFPLPALAQSGLTIVRSPDNQDEWEGITQRLEAAGISYQVLEWSQVDSADDLAKAQLLFFPNVETWSREQANAMETWLNEGGRAIISGAVGTQSPLRVRRQLDSILGAYWSMSLPPLVTLEVVGCQEVRLCAASPNWIPADMTSGSVRGGVLATTADTQTVAAWRIAGNAPAVVANDRVAFLGWQWGAGNEDSTEFDMAWFRAVLGHYGVAISPEGLQPPEMDSPPSPVPDKPRISAPPEAEITDPASQVAPPGLRVEPGNRPITRIEALRMRQELTALLGRVESALLAAESMELPTAIGEKGGTGEGGILESAASDAITEAQQVLQAFPDWVANQQYGEARDRWLQARRQLWDRYPNDRPRAPSEIRAIWLDRGTIVRAGSPEGLARVFDRLASAGINTVFFETINAGYPIYPSQVAPQQNPLIRNWDPLKAAVELAQARNMELHAWMWVFAIGNTRHNALVGESGDYPGPVLARHPDWANYDNEGRTQHLASGKWFLDPANPEARAYLMEIAEEIISNYDVDGLQLDYIRYPFQDPSAERTYGYGVAGRGQFRELTGVDPIDISPDDRELWQQWTDFRTEQIDSFVAQMSKLLRRKNPDLILSAAVFPQSEHDRIHKLQQHWENWIENGTIDLIVPMTYALDTNRLQQLSEPLLAAPSSVPIVPSVKLHDLSEIQEIDQIQALRDLPTAGYALFAAEMLDDSLYQILTSTQPPSDNQPIPYRQPFKAAVDRFETLQREWKFVRDRDRLWLPESEATEMQTQIEELSRELVKLDGEPTSEQLQLTLDRLTQFRENFEGWMASSNFNNAYQIRTWQNRLVALETLLRYGDRRMFAREGNR
ncbi:MAG TPA: family 10 glycosylhydrolase [Oscillatoriales cyanobacterium M4454_W2019_049]|nr:family 10 glycosylhydrolase [Oscillatoriales cyanobacterium M4454_W2019_049]